MKKTNVNYILLLAALTLAACQPAKQRPPKAGAESNSAASAEEKKKDNKTAPLSEIIQNNGNMPQLGAGGPLGENNQKFNPPPVDKAQDQNLNIKNQEKMLSVIKQMSDFIKEINVKLNNTKDEGEFKKLREYVQMLERRLEDYITLESDLRESEADSIEEESPSETAELNPTEQSEEQPALPPPSLTPGEIASLDQNQPILEPNVDETTPVEPAQGMETSGAPAQQPVVPAELPSGTDGSSPLEVVEPSQNTNPEVPVASAPDTQNTQNVRVEQPAPSVRPEVTVVQNQQRPATPPTAEVRQTETANNTRTNDEAPEAEQQSSAGAGAQAQSEHPSANQTTENTNQESTTQKDQEDVAAATSTQEVQAAQIPEDMRINEDKTGAVAPNGQTNTAAVVADTTNPTDSLNQEEVEKKGIAYLKVDYIPNQPEDPKQFLVVEGETEAVYQAALVSVLGDKEKEDLILEIANELQQDLNAKVQEDGSKPFTVISKKIIIDGVEVPSEKIEKDVTGKRGIEIKDFLMQEEAMDFKDGTLALVCKDWDANDCSIEVYDKDTEKSYKTSAELITDAHEKQKLEDVIAEMKKEWIARGASGLLSVVPEVYAWGEIKGTIIRDANEENSTYAISQLGQTIVDDRSREGTGDVVKPNLVENQQPVPSTATTVDPAPLTPAVIASNVSAKAAEAIQDKKEKVTSFFKNLGQNITGAVSALSKAAADSKPAEQQVAQEPTVAPVVAQQKPICAQDQTEEIIGNLSIAEGCDMDGIYECPIEVESGDDIEPGYKITGVFHDDASSNLILDTISSETFGDTASTIKVKVTGCFQEDDASENGEDFFDIVKIEKQ